MKTLYEKLALKALRKMPKKTALALEDKIAAFAADGFGAHVDAKPLKGTDNGYRIRQGGWRALLYVTGDTLVVTTIKPRGDVYK